MKSFIPFFKINYDHNEIREIKSVLNSGMLTMGSKTDLFENKIAEKLNIKKNNVAAVSNCTVALHLALVSARVGAGDEVLCSSLTFVADASSILYVGAKPVFVDIESNEDLNISVNDLQNKITKKTKAIIMTHYAGFPCKIEKIKSIAKKHNLILIEDACHTIFSKYKKKYFGTYGDCGVFSLYGNKNITTGEGGIIIGNNKLIKKIKKLRNHGIEKSLVDRFKKRNPLYDIKSLGYNYRIDDIRSSLGIQQLKKIKIINDKRKKIANNYKELIENNLRNFNLPFSNQFTKNYSYHLFVLILPKKINRASLIKFLRSKGIETSVHYRPIHKLGFYRKNNFKLPNLDKIYNRLLSLPIYPKLNIKDQKKIINSIQSYAKN